MLPSTLARLRAAWDSAEHGELYLVCNRFIAYVESPEEAMDRDHLDRESVMRVWLTEEDAKIYKEQLEETRGLTWANVIKLSLDDLFAFAEAKHKKSMEEWNAPLRMDLCSIQKGEWPRVIDPLWTAMEERH